MNKNVNISRLSETFDQFEMKSQLEDGMRCESIDEGEADEIERAHTFNESIWKATAVNQQNASEFGE